MSEVLFSVIVPVYNVECYLRQCIDSILAQTYRDFELILVDDGSQDSSGIICDEYAAKDSRITVIHKENQGHTSARRIGLKNSFGQYICFVDSDDQVSDELLQNVADIISESSSDVITFKWKKVDMNGNLLCEETPAFNEGEIGKEEYLKKILSSTSLNSLCKKICRRTLFDLDTDYSDYYKIRNGEDLLQTVPIVYRANKFYYLDKALYIYRMNPQSITHQYNISEYKVLNVVRPVLYQCMIKLGYNTNENLEIFFRYYLKSLWQKLFNYGVNVSADDKVLNEIYEYPMVAKSKKYCRLASLRERIELKLFFEKHWRVMNFIFKVDKRITDCMKKIRNLYKRKPDSNGSILP